MIMREILDKIFKNKKLTILIPIIVSLFLYFLFVLFGTGEEKNNMLILLPLMGLFWYFGVFLVVYIQIKNPLCPEKFLDFFVFIATIFFSIGAVFLTVSALINGMHNFNPVTIPACLTLSSLSWAHSKRNR
jgi:hypothetical protein